MNNNMSLWEQVCKTNPNETKDFKGKGGFRGTAICAQSQRKKATEMFGPFGIGWYLKNEKYDIIDVSEDYHHKILVYTASLVYFWNDTEGKINLFSDIEMFNYSYTKKQWSKNNDIFKKVRTDAVTKGLSELGFNSDVFEGKFDDNKYINDLKKEFKDKEEAEKKEAEKKNVAEKEAPGSIDKKDMLKKAVNGKEIELTDEEIYSKIRNTLGIILKISLPVKFWTNKDAMEIIETIKSIEGIDKKFSELSKKDKLNLVSFIQKNGKEVWENILIDRDMPM